jgi:hypothetical protein
VPVVAALVVAGAAAVVGALVSILRPRPKGSKLAGAAVVGALVCILRPQPIGSKLAGNTVVLL